MSISTFWKRLKPRLSPLGDLTAWCLFVGSAIPLAALSPGMVLTLLTWTAYALALMGVAVMINRLVTPQIVLWDWLQEARTGNVAAAIVVFGVFMLLAATFLGLIVWAKA